MEQGCREDRKERREKQKQRTSISRRSRRTLRVDIISHPSFPFAVQSIDGSQPRSNFVVDMLSKISGWYRRYGGEKKPTNLFTIGVFNFPIPLRWDGAVFPYRFPSEVLVESSDVLEHRFGDHRVCVSSNLRAVS
jgi:hypothetical protein